MATLKRLLNRSEEVTDERLRAVCETYGTRVFAKPRLADVLPIEGSGIATAAYSFALRSHIDFVIADEITVPLFAVEFDGPHHNSEKQIARDTLKNDLCRRLGLPLLRIDHRFLKPRYMNMDLLSWLVGVVLTRRADYALVESGDLSHEDAAASDPIFCAPFVISYEARERLIAMHEAGVCDRYTPFFIGVDEQENAHAVAGVRLASELWVSITASINNQGFVLLAEDLLEEVIYIKLADALQAVVAGRRTPVTAEAFAELVGSFLRKYRSRHAFLIDPRTGEITILG